MLPEKETVVKIDQQTFINAVLRLGIIGFLIYLCRKVVLPFEMLLLWGLLLAIMLYPLQQKFAAKLSNKQGLSSTIIVLFGILLVGIPLYLMGDSFIQHANTMQKRMAAESLTISPPSPTVADWPIIGEKAHEIWSEAADNLPHFIEKNKIFLQKVSKATLAKIGSAFTSISLLLGSLITAGIMMAYGERGTNACHRILVKIAGPTIGPRLQTLTIATVRSVATGVLGVAFIQALLFGVGFFLMGIPFAALLAVIVMFIGIVQLPALIAGLPVIMYVWSGDGTAAINTVFTLYFIAASLADNILKPILLGRGVDAPMPIILIGALGGMISGGLIGLFLGAVFLAIGYQIFMNWVDKGHEESIKANDNIE